MALITSDCVRLQVEFVQTYDICIRDTAESINGLVGDYGHCIFRCERQVLTPTPPDFFELHLPGCFV